jgi:hypothetical protein
LLLNLVDKAKIEICLHGQVYVLVANNAKEKRNEVSTTRLVTVRIVLELPLMASYHENTRFDVLAGGYLFFGARVALNHKQVIPAIRAGIDGRRDGELAVGDDRYTSER